MGRGHLRSSLFNLCIVGWLPRRTGVQTAHCPAHQAGRTGGHGWRNPCLLCTVCSRAPGGSLSHGSSECLFWPCQIWNPSGAPALLGAFQSQWLAAGLRLHGHRIGRGYGPSTEPTGRWQISYRFLVLCRNLCVGLAAGQRHCPHSGQWQHTSMALEPTQGCH